jgi:hypothetical protein
MCTRRRLSILALSLSLLVGCAYQGHYSFTGTRKLLDSDAPVATRIVFSPFVMVMDSLASPVTAYMDAASHAPEERHLYVSFVGLRELWGSDLGIGYAALGTLFVAPIDLAWFPVAGTIDTTYALTSEDPPPRRTPTFPAEPHDDGSPTGRRSSPNADPAHVEPPPTGRTTPDAVDR